MYAVKQEENVLAAQEYHEKQSKTLINVGRWILYLMHYSTDEDSGH